MPISLKRMQDYARMESGRFNFCMDLDNIRKNRFRDLSKPIKRREFIQKIMDLIFEYQDILDTNEMLLYDYYMRYEIKFLETIKEESEKNG
jgi:uncharacterized Fe-S cluster-containing radical SAM superfamily protein